MKQPVLSFTQAAAILGNKAARIFCVLLTICLLAATATQSKADAGNITTGLKNHGIKKAKAPLGFAINSTTFTINPDDGNLECKLTLSKNITGFAAYHFSLTTTGNITATIVDVFDYSFNGSQNTVYISYTGTSGTVRVNLINDNGLDDIYNGTLPYNSAVYTVTAPVSITSLTAPETLSNATTVNYTLTFPEAVTGVTAGNFSLTTTGTITGASIGTPVASGNTWTIPVNTGTGDGDITLNLANATGLGKAVSNTLPYTGTTVTIDKTKPLITIGSPSVASIAAGAGNVTYSISISDTHFDVSEVLDFVSLRTTGDANGEVNVTGQGRNYTVTISNISGTGTLGIVVGANAAYDRANNTSAATTSATFEVTPAPVSIAGLTPSATLTNAATVNYTLEFPEEITGLTATNFELVTTGTITGASIGTPVASGNSWTVPVTTGTGDGNITLNLVNATGLGKAVSNTLPYTGTTVTIDKTPPTVTIGAPSLSRIRNSQVKYNITYTGESNVNVSIFYFINNQVKTGTVSSGSISLGANQSSVTYGDFTGNGTFTFKIPAGAATDAAGNQSLASELAPILTVDNAGPVVSSIAYTTTNADPTKAVAGDVVTMTFTTDEPITNNPSVVVAGVANSALVEVSTNNYSVTHTVGTDDPTGFITFQSFFDDALGNATVFSQTSTVSKVNPAEVISLATTVSSPTNAATINYTLTFSANVTGLTAGNFEIAASGISGASVGTPTNNGDNTWTIPVNTGTGSGSINLSFVNATGLSSPVTTELPVQGNAVTIDKTPPTVSITTNDVRSKSGAVFIFTYSGQNAITTTANDITVQTTGTVTYTKNFYGADGNTAGVRINVTGDGTISVSLAAGTASDAAGNLAPSAGPSATVIIDNTPAVISNVSFTTSNTDPAKAVAGDVVTMFYTLSEAVKPNINFRIGGVTSNNAIVDLGSNNYKVSRTLTGNETPGPINFFTSILDLTSNSTAVNETSTIVIPEPAVAVTSLSTAAATPGNAATVNYTLEFPEGITGVTAANFELVTTGVSGTSIGTPVASGNSWTVPVNTGSGDGTIRLNLVNATGLSKTVSNTLPVEGTTITIDKTGPAIAFTAPSIPLVSSGNSVIRVDFTGHTEINLTAEQVILNKTGTADVTSIEIGATANNEFRNVRLLGFTGNGSVTVSIAAGAAVDAVGNLSTAAGPSGVITVDNTPVVLSNISFTTSNASSTKAFPGDTVTMYYTLSEPIATQNFSIASAGGNIGVSLGGLNYKVSRIMRTSDARGSNILFRSNFRDAAGNQTGVDQASGIGFYENNFNLDGLTINQGTLSPAFSSDVTTYSAGSISGSNVLRITPVSYASAASIKINGVSVQSFFYKDVTLLPGNNTIEIVVTAESGNTKTYTINAAYGSSIATATFTLSPNAKLAGVNVGSAMKNYTTSVDRSTTSIMVKPKSDDVNATVSVNGSVVPRGSFSNPIDISDGGATINIESVSENGLVTMTYSIAVSKAGSNNANLSVELNTKSVLYQTTGTAQVNYKTTVDYDTESIQLIPKSEDVNAVVTVNDVVVPRGSRSEPIELTGPTTIVNMKIVAQDGVTSRTYTIAVSKTGSNNARMSFAISGKPVLLPLSSGPAQENYKTTVAVGASSITITPKFEDANASVIIDGQPVANKTASQEIQLTSLTTLVTMQVTAQDGTTTRSYSVSITKSGSNNANITMKLTPASKLAGVNAGPAMYNYTTSVDPATTTLVLKPTSDEPNATVSVNGDVVLRGSSVSLPLLDAVTMISIRSVAQDGVTIQTYSIAVSKNGSNNADVDFRLSPASELTQALSGGPALVNYQATAAYYGQSTVKIVPTAGNSKSVITIDGNIVANKTPSQAIALSPGLNMIPISVTAQDGVTTRTYSIALTVEAAPPLRMASRMVEETPVEVSSALSPNGDGINDYLAITGIEAYPKNKLSIMNSKGAYVFDVDGYDNSTRVFNGHSKTGTPQVSGTYFYLLEYETPEGTTKRQTGYIVLKN